VNSQQQGQQKKIEANHKTSVSVMHVLFESVLIAFLFIGVEWGFYVTEASISFMYKLSFLEKAQIGLLSAFLGMVLAACGVIVFAGLDWIARKISLKVGGYLLVFPEAILLGIFYITIIDNFTYTVWHFGLSTISWPIAIIYFLLFTASWVYIDIRLARPGSQSPRWFEQGKVYLTLGITAVSLIVGVVAYTHSHLNASTEVVQRESTQQLPNIIIFGTDGLSAANMSVYGSSNETTPFLDEFAKTSLVSENNFTNAGHSMGSDVSLLTSKSPLQTGVLYPPDILRGEDIEESLPNILKSLGYETTQLAVPHYADADVANLEGSFDSVNCEPNSQLGYWFNKSTNYRFNDELYLFNSIVVTARDRLFEIYFVAKMDNPIADITNLKIYRDSDVERMSCLFDDLDQAIADGKPLFAHVHMLTTHGSLFYPEHQTFSGGMIQTKNWMNEFYSDSILDYDEFANELVDHLKAIGQYENTIVVIYTDHGEQWSSDRRIPLIFHFPGDEYAGQVTENTQNMDIAPTLLDYLGVEQPVWMTGSSLLQPLDPKRLIISTYTKSIEGDDSGLWGIKGGTIHAPFYQFSIVRAMQCQKMITFDLDKMTVTESKITNYVNPCDADSLESQDEIKTQVGSYLESLGFDLPENW
jgi:hypothetical protein